MPRARNRWITERVGVCKKVAILILELIPKQLIQHTYEREGKIDHAANQEAA